ncbi:MAG: carbon starvation protein A [Sulfolobales archaeon]|nr:carbon starvation protein A [Sulfolobales archaeon]MDW8082352.1 carbon starvation protein A [Sulfolobales archaeon]
MYPILILLVVLLLYGAAYIFYGKKLLERRVVKADPKRLTPAYEKFDGIDYVPANKYVLYGHHFASIAGAGPIVGPAVALAWGWFLPLIWVLFGNIFIGAVHDYTSIMASVRHGGVSIMTISENVMGRKARYIFLAYVWFALILVLAAFFSVASATFADVPTAATVSIIYMPLALLFGILVYKLGFDVRQATVIVLILVVAGIAYSFYTPVYLTYEGWVVVLALYSILAAALPVWYLLQPRDYLNAYLLWSFVILAVIAPLLLPVVRFTGPAIITFVAKGSVIGAPAGTPAAGLDIAWFWPVVPLTIACGALSGFHSVVGSGTTSKQLSSELDALLVGYGGMLTEGAVSSLAVILPAALVWNFAAVAQDVGLTTDLLLKAGLNITATPNILRFAGAARFYTAYGFAQGIAWSRLVGVELFPQLFIGFRTFAAWALTAFILTTLDTANRLARFAWSEMFDWLKPRRPTLHKLVTNRWVASTLAVVIGAAMAYPTIPGVGRAYLVVWPAFAGTNQLLAALALLTSTLWVYAMLKVRGAISLLMMIPALFLWLTVTLALLVWLVFIVPNLPLIYIGTGIIVGVSVVLDILLIYLFIRGLKSARAL